MPQNLLLELGAFLGRPHTDIAVLVGSETTEAEPYAVQRLNLETEVSGEFRRMVLNTVVPKLTETLVRPYDPSYKTDSHEMFYVNLDNAERIAPVVESLTQVNLAEIFAADDVFVDGLRFYSVVLGSGVDERAIFIRRYDPKKELTRSKWMALRLNRGQYDLVRDKVFLFDEEVDCIVWRGTLFIRNVNNFHSIFKHLEKMRAMADQVVTDVSSVVPISNLGDFRQACTGQIQMMQKLASIARKPYLARVTMDDIKRTIQVFSLPVQIDVVAGEEKLRFEADLRKRWLILKLLDDDYLGSVMTNEKYEVNSKSRLAS